MQAETESQKAEEKPHPAHSAKRFAETIYIDSYEDIFSDFDYGPYEARRVSEDFLHEIETRLKYARSGKIELYLVLPDGERDKEVESRARRRLRQVFAAKAHAAEVHLREYRKSGVFYFIIGSIFLVGAWVLTTVLTGPHNFIYNATGVILTPAGWFWGVKGLERLFDVPAEVGKRRILYTLLSEATISFDEASNLAVAPLHDPAFLHDEEMD
jgi:hypothetical protein